MLAEGFHTMRESIHHVKVLQEMVRQLNLQGQSDDMTWGKEMLADGVNVMQKITQRVKVLHAMIRPLKIQSDAIPPHNEMLADGFKALQKARLHLKELEEIVHQMNMLEQHAKENGEAARVETEEDPVSVNKKQTFSTLQSAEQFVNEVLAMGEKDSSPCEHSEKRTKHSLNTQSCDDHTETQSPRCEPAHTIVIKRFPRRTTKSELYEYFHSYGVCDIDLPMCNDPNHPRYGTVRGFAFIHYETAEQSDRAFHALSTSGLIIRGKKVRTQASKYNKALRGATLSPHGKPAEITEGTLPTNKETDAPPESVPVSAEPLSSMVPDAPPAEAESTPPPSMNKKRPFSTLEDAEQFVNQVLTMGPPSLNEKHSQLYLEEAYKIRSIQRAIYALNKQSWDDLLDSMVKYKRDDEETSSSLCEPNPPANQETARTSSVTTAPETSQCSCSDSTHTHTAIIAKHIPRNSNVGELYECFRLYGNVCNVHLPTYKDPKSPQYGSFRGFAVITYSTAEESARAVRALSVTGLPLYDRRVMVEFAEWNKPLVTP